MISMTNTVSWDEMTGRSRTGGRFSQKSQGVTNAGLARSDGLTDDNDAVDELESHRDERRRNRALAITNLHDVSPTQFARDFRLRFGELPSETLKRSAKRLISRSRSRPAALIRSRPKCKSPPVLADRDQQKS